MRPKGQIFELKRFRAERNLTQKEISEAVNLPQSFLSAIEHGKRSAPQSLLDDLTRIYKVDNISDYLRDREEATFGEVSEVHNSIVNSPGGFMLLNEFKNKLSQQDIQKILEITEKSLPPNPPNAETVADLVKLLSASEARCKQAEARVKELEKQVLDLQERLKNHKKK